MRASSALSSRVPGGRGTGESACRPPPRSRPSPALVGGCRVQGARTRRRGVGWDWALGAQRERQRRERPREQVGARSGAGPGPEGRRRPPHLGRSGAPGLRGRSRPENRACPQPRPRPAPSNESPRPEGLSAHSTRSPTPRRRPPDTAPRAPAARPSQLGAPSSASGHSSLRPSCAPAPGVQVPVSPQPSASLWPPRGVSKSSLSTPSRCRVHAPPGRAAGVFGELC